MKKIASYLIQSFSVMIFFVLLAVPFVLADNNTIPGAAINTAANLTATNTAAAYACAKEGEYTSGAVSPNYVFDCCAGLTGFDTQAAIGSGLLCYNSTNGIPKCGAIGSRSEGWYYPNGSLLSFNNCAPTVTVCSAEYAPVCGQPQMPVCPPGKVCSQVMPSLVTYSNKCEMEKVGATFVSSGVCTSSSGGGSGSALPDSTNTVIPETAVKTMPIVVPVTPSSEGIPAVPVSTKPGISDMMPVAVPATPVVEPNYGYRGFRYAKWECYDGKNEVQGGESSCKPSETWQQYAQEACAGHCYADNSKCGVNSYGVSIECGDAVANTTVASTSMQIAVPAVRSGISVVSVSDVEVCYQKIKQENPNEKEDVLWTKCKLMNQQQPAVSQQPTTTVSTAIVPTASTQQCDSADEQLMNELNNAVQKYEIIQKEGRSEQETQEVQDYIKSIKDKIDYKKNNCWSSAAQVASTSARPECEIVNDNLKKELEEGYIKTAIVYKEGNPERIKEIDNYMMQLKNKVSKNKESCWTVKTSGGETAVAAAPAAISTSWVDAETKPADVATYYRAKMDTILADEKSIDSQIMQLKDLKNKIDMMIEELINKKEIIGADDFNGLVGEFKISSTEISADDQKFDSVNKEFVKNIGNKSVSIKQGADNVVLTVDNVEVNAPEFAITDKIKVDDIELKALPDKIKKHIKENITDVEIVREKDKLVYNVKTEEERKLLGIFSVTAEKNTVLDATSENADLIKEEKPWWYGLSGEVKE